MIVSLSNVTENSVTPRFAPVDYYPFHFYPTPIWAQRHTTPESGGQCFTFKTANLQLLNQQ